MSTLDAKNISPTIKGKKKEPLGINLKTSGSLYEKKEKNYKTRF
jgi:hypothetical protein